MPNLDLEFEWIDPAGARGPELRATWARLQITVGGQPVTRLLDHASRTVRDGVFLPLYPIAEWLAANWWTLLFELETPGRSLDHSYAQRHNLRAGREGFALPSLMIQPLGERVRFDWRPSTLVAQNVEFLGRGTAHIEWAECAQRLSDFVTSVILRLDEFGVHDTLLHTEWESITTADPEEREFCQTAAALGLNPYSISDDLENSIINVHRELPQQILEEFFGAADFLRLRNQAQFLVDALDTNRSNTARLDEILLLRGKMGGHARWRGAPWEEGYEFAKGLRHHLGLDAQPLQSMQDLSRVFGMEDQLYAAITTYPSGQNNPFDVVGADNEVGSPGFVISHPREDAQKFAFCRGLFEFFLADPGEPILVTRTKSERQKRNRAFAAEFLVPAASLRARIAADSVSEEEVDDLAAEFGVSPHVVVHQIQNHHIARTIPL